jgi:hypothetical protein
MHCVCTNLHHLSTDRNGHIPLREGERSAGLSTFQLPIWICTPVSRQGREPQPITAFPRALPLLS